MHIDQLIAKLIELREKRTSFDPEVYCRNSEGYFCLYDVEIDSDGSVVLCIAD
jgi:hypothetical protein